MIEKELQNLGLSEKEAKIYLAALELGAASAHDIAKKSGINRATAYFVLKSLMKYGLVSEVAEDKTSKFTAENPGQLEVFLKKKEQEIKESERRFQELLPELRSLYNASEDKPIVRYHDGKEGPELIRKEMLTLKDDDIYVFYNLDKAKTVFPEQNTEEFRKKKLQRNLNTKAIYWTKEKDRLSVKGKGFERYKIDSNENKINGDISIYGNIIKISKFMDQNIGVITIEDKEIAETFKSMFRLAWESVKQKK